MFEDEGTQNSIPSLDCVHPTCDIITNVTNSILRHVLKAKSQNDFIQQMMISYKGAIYSTMVNSVEGGVHLIFQIGSFNFFLNIY